VLRIIPGILISNVSFPKSLEREIIERGKSPKLMISYVLESARQLEKAGADFIVLPCNTLHEILPVLKREIKLPFIDLVEETVKLLGNFKKVGILCSKRTRDSRLYDSLLKNVGVIYPNECEQEQVSEIILKIINNASTKLDKEFIEELISNMKNRGVEKIVLACTDLANIVEIDGGIIDTQKVLIDAVKKGMNDDNYKNNQSFSE
jgi:aspartate racemase